MSDCPAFAEPTAMTTRWRRGLLWGSLVTLVMIALVALVWLTRSHEHNRLQEDTEAMAQRAAADVRQRLQEDVQALQQLLWLDLDREHWPRSVQEVLRDRGEIVRVELRDARFRLEFERESASHGKLFAVMSRDSLALDAQAACVNAQRFASPMFSRSYFVPMAGGLGAEVIDVCLPRRTDAASGGGTMAADSSTQATRGASTSANNHNTRPSSNIASHANNGGALVATVVLSRLLERAVQPVVLLSHEVLLIESDGTRLARAGPLRGAGLFKADHLIDIDGLTLPLRVDSVARSPSLIPNLLTALVTALSVALCGVLALLVHDMRRRSLAEGQLADALSFRNAMEDSLVTGLRARDLAGRITYVNAAFSKMVGFSPETLIGTVNPPYWPPELVSEYIDRNARRFAEGGAREGFETLFMRQDGERFPVLVFEAPLVDGRGKHAGWMSTVLDVSAQRRAEELSRQQQDKLQAAARLATMGEMATLLSHELNQPLAAIASYATGSMNLLPSSAADTSADAPTQQMIRQAVSRIAEQAERAGRIIRSVHQFVRRREQLRENLRCVELFDAVLPLVRLSARRSHTRVDVTMAEPPPRVSCDRTMVEQVLLNLARNGIQAMEADTPLEDRVLTLRAAQTQSDRWVMIEVVDGGPGIAEDVAAKLFTPFFTTKTEGMGIGLSMCRTVIEQHGGSLEFRPGPSGRGTAFRFTLPGAIGASRDLPEARSGDTVEP